MCPWGNLSRPPLEEASSYSSTMQLSWCVSTSLPAEELHLTKLILDIKFQWIMERMKMYWICTHGLKKKILDLQWGKLKSQWLSHSSAFDPSSVGAVGDHWWSNLTNSNLESWVPGRPWLYSLWYDPARNWTHDLQVSGLTRLVSLSVLLLIPLGIVCSLTWLYSLGATGIKIILTISLFFLQDLAVSRNKTIA